MVSVLWRLDDCSPLHRRRLDISLFLIRCIAAGCTHLLSAGTSRTKSRSSGVATMSVLSEDDLACGLWSPSPPWSESASDATSSPVNSTSNCGLRYHDSRGAPAMGRPPPMRMECGWTGAHSTSSSATSCQDSLCDGPTSTISTGRLASTRSRKPPSSPTATDGTMNTGCSSSEWTSTLNEQCGMSCSGLEDASTWKPGISCVPQPAKATCFLFCTAWTSSVAVFAPSPTT
mmetsp:Transcript_101973/g.277189  ORF Transcript_101973/g.277189 Transcript_101973/m.277189 type:complete len:231 (-) Transcript_101973:952-1644(-)